jgi:hypothetical protein
VFVLRRRIPATVTGGCWDGWRVGRTVAVVGLARIAAGARTPPGVSDRLLGVEQKARGVKGFGVSGAWEPNGLLSLAADLKLPKFEADGNRYQYSWPPPQPNLALQIAAIRPDPFLVHEAAKGTYIEERNRRILEDNRRQIAEAEQRQREFEKQKTAEIEAAKERDRQARERGWPSG